MAHLKPLADLDPYQYEIRAAQERLAAADQHLRDTVKEMTAKGTTWAEVGEALGTTRQAAWERFNTRKRTDEGT